MFLQHSKATYYVDFIFRRDKKFFIFLVGGINRNGLSELKKNNEFTSNFTRI